MLYAHGLEPFQTIQAWHPHSSQLLTRPLKIIWICGLITMFWSNSTQHALVDIARSRSSHPHWPRRAAGSAFGTLADILHPLASTASLRLHATHTSSHTCVLKHWQQLLWNCLGLYSVFCVFSFDDWNILLILNYPKGMDKQIQFTALGYGVPTFPFAQTSCHFTWLYLMNYMLTEGE